MHLALTLWWIFCKIKTWHLSCCPDWDRFLLTSGVDGVGVAHSVALKLWAYIYLAPTPLTPLPSPSPQAPFAPSASGQSALCQVPVGQQHPNPDPSTMLPNLPYPPSPLPPAPFS